MKIKNITKIVLGLSLSSGLIACNNGSTSAANTLNTAVENNKTILDYTKSHDNDIYFNNVSIQNYTAIDHGITKGQPWDGAWRAGSDHIDVKAGRKDSADTSRWAASKKYIIGGWPNWGVLGTMNFIYHGDSEQYKCDFMLNQDGKLNSARNTAIIYSNITIGGGERAYYGGSYKHSTSLLCTNISNNNLVAFTITGEDYDKFSVSNPDYQTYASASLTNANFTRSIINSFNSMPQDMQKTKFAHNIYDLGNDKDSIIAATASTVATITSAIDQNVNSSVLNESSIIYGTAQTLTHNVGNFCNASDINQNQSSSSYTYNFSTTTTTTTTTGYDVGGEVGFEFKLPLDASKMTTKINGKYSHQSGASYSSTQSYSVTSPPQSIMVPAHSQMKVVSELTTRDISGSINFDNQIINNAVTFGGGTDLNCFLGKCSYFQGYSGTIPAVDALKYALRNNTIQLAPQIIYDKNSDTLKLNGNVSFNTTNGAYQLNVSIYSTGKRIETPNDCVSSVAASSTTNNNEASSEWNIVDHYSIPVQTN